MRPGLKRLDELFQVLQQKRSAEEISRLGGFSRYPSGIMYEDSGFWNDALVDYEHAAKACVHYERDFGVPQPSILAADLDRRTSCARPGRSSRPTSTCWTIL